MYFEKYATESETQQLVLCSIALQILRNMCFYFPVIYQVILTSRHRFFKETCCKVLEQNLHLFEYFSTLGTESELNEELTCCMEKYVYWLHSEKRCLEVD